MSKKLFNDLMRAAQGGPFPVEAWNSIRNDIIRNSRDDINCGEIHSAAKEYIRNMPDEDHGFLYSNKDSVVNFINKEVNDLCG